jgi:hypothetical protein
LQAASTVTRKGANMRMGKGKGKGGRLRARVNVGSWLVLLSKARPGLCQALHRHVSSRCSFGVGLAREVCHPGVRVAD